MEWTIGELAERASAALTPTAQLNGRVRDMPNERLIRWYSTIGLLDPPSARRGRVAMYGRRHLLQIVAVKRRQSDGRTIAEIQAELAGATDRTLESIARLPEPAPENAPGTAPENASGNTPGHPPESSPENAPAPPAETGSPRAARPRFWAGPSAASADTGPPADPAPAPPKAKPSPASSVRTPPAPYAPQAVLVHGVRLANGVTLMLDTGGHVPSPDDLAEIAAASEGLLSLLRERGLTPPEGIHA